MDVSKVKGKELRLLRRNIGMIFQSFNLVKRSSVYKNVLSGRIGYHNWIETICGIYTKREKMLALQSIDSLGILNKSYVRADNLSGGQQQRVALARALTQEPSLILADEPVASLDPITTISVMNDFKKINKEKGITIVANMHHVDLALKYSNRIIGIKAGEIVFDGTPDQVNDEVLQKIYGRALERGENLGGVDND
ncbi:MAG: ATP-binding cassette domain-containing protein [Clostridium sp.]|nr:ATP-binding cassette domain-containing protein [Clostridium sp.]